MWLRRYNAGAMGVRDGSAPFSSQDVFVETELAGTLQVSFTVDPPEGYTATDE